MVLALGVWTAITPMSTSTPETSLFGWSTTEKGPTGAYRTVMALASDANLAQVLVQMNPLTYRGYVYDRETTLYYLQSRYYDPELGRFLNADAYAGTGDGEFG